MALQSARAEYMQSLIRGKRHSLVAELRAAEAGAGVGVEEVQVLGCGVERQHFAGREPDSALEAHGERGSVAADVAVDHGVLWRI